LTKELLKRKQKEYGDFESNAYIIAKFIKSVLEVVNKQKLKVPITIVPQLMIVLKLTRTIEDGSKGTLHKPDTFADIKGYCDLLDDMVKQIEKDENGK
tara:strand:+ start:212 stop:505 length:294 start_codon:yes stop_codon:yes gene_type:complete